MTAEERAQKRQQLIRPPCQLSVEQLKQRIRFHESSAALFDQHEEPILAERIRGLAEMYRLELESREKGASS